MYAIKTIFEKENYIEFADQAPFFYDFHEK